MRILEIILDEAAVSLAWAVGAEIARKNGVVMQKKMRQKGRKEEKREQGKSVCAVCWLYLRRLQVSGI